ncbi:MAG: hypothetical protein HC880_01875 [Bacteroidia bacterium]|nr:hypothetical protein [Bacteroidia bacterium]
MIILAFNKILNRLTKKQYFAQRVIPEALFSSPLSDLRANINDQWFGNYNALFKMSERASLKTNFYYLNDAIFSQQLFESRNIIDGQTLITSDLRTVQKQPLQYKGDLELKYNLSNNALVEYEMNASQEEIITPSNVLVNDQRLLQSRLNSQNTYFREKLRITKKLTDQKAFQLSVSHYYNRILQVLKIEPSITDSTNQQSDIQKSNASKHSVVGQATLLGARAQARYALSLGGTINFSHIYTNLYGQNKSSEQVSIHSENDLNYQKKSIFSVGSYHFILGRWHIRPAYSLILLDQNLAIKSPENNALNQIDWIIEPSLAIKYLLSPQAFVLINTNYNQNSGVDQYTFPARVLRSSRDIVSNHPNLALRKTFSSGITYINRNSYTQRNFSLGVRYSNNTGNFFSDVNIEPTFTRTSYFYFPEDAKDFSVDCTFEQFVDAVAANIKFSSNYSLSTYKNILNSSDLRHNLNQFLTTELSLRTAFDKVNFENDFGLSRIQSQSNNGPVFSNIYLSNTFLITWWMVERLNFTLTSEYYLPNTSHTSEDFLFFDASIRFLPKEGQYELNLIAKNLLNVKNFNQFEANDFSTSFFQSSLLSRYVLLNLSYTF